MRKRRRRKKKKEERRRLGESTTNGGCFRTTTKPKWEQTWTRLQQIEPMHTVHGSKKSQRLKEQHVLIPHPKDFLVWPWLFSVFTNTCWRKRDLDFWVEQTDRTQSLAGLSTLVWIQEVKQKLCIAIVQLDGPEERLSMSGSGAMNFSRCVRNTFLCVPSHHELFLLQTLIKFVPGDEAVVIYINCLSWQQEIKRTAQASNLDITECCFKSMQDQQGLEQFAKGG